MSNNLPTIILGMMPVYESFDYATRQTLKCVCKYLDQQVCLVNRGPAEHKARNTILRAWRRTRHLRLCRAMCTSFPFTEMEHWKLFWDFSQAVDELTQLAITNTTRFAFRLPILRSILLVQFLRPDHETDEDAARYLTYHDYIMKNARRLDMFLFEPCGLHDVPRVMDVLHYLYIELHPSDKERLLTIREHYNVWLTTALPAFTQAVRIRFNYFPYVALYFGEFLSVDVSGPRTLQQRRLCCASQMPTPLRNRLLWERFDVHRHCIHVEYFKADMKPQLLMTKRYNLQFRDGKVYCM